MRKAAVRHGDPTTTRGFVMAYSSTIHDDGKRVALSGDEATCGNCKGVFKIFGTGQGMSEKGRDMVVDGDHVLCPCNKNRVIVGNNPGIFLTITEGSAGVSKMMSTAQSAIARGASIATYDDRFILRDADGKVLAYTAYAMQRTSGIFEYGETDCDGHTHVLASTASAETINVYLAG